MLMLALGGCAGTKDAVFPADLPPMQAIYDDHFADAPSEALVKERSALRTRSAAEGPRANGEYVASAPSAQPDTHAASTRLERAAAPIHERFARLPNPDLVLFVFPHLAGDEAVPIPGYATVFPLYERPRYALPGETP